MTTATTRPQEFRLWVLAGVVIAAAAARLVPHPPNFTPLGAMALFSGAMLGRRWLGLALVLPLAALLVSDTAIGLGAAVGVMGGPGFGIYRSQTFVYCSFLLITLLGSTLQNHRRNPVRIVGASLGASVLFFVVTNFGVWLTSGMYAHTPAELLRCYVQAIPFFGNTVTGDLTFALLFFGGLAFVENSVRGEQHASIVKDDAQI